MFKNRRIHDKRKLRVGFPTHPVRKYPFTEVSSCSTDSKNS